MKECEQSSFYEDVCRVEPSTVHQCEAYILLLLIKKNKRLWQVVNRQTKQVKSVITSAGIRWLRVHHLRVLHVRFSGHHAALLVVHCV